MAVQKPGGRNSAPAVRSSVHQNFGMGRKSAGHKAFGQNSVVQNVGVNRKLKVPVAAKTRAPGSH